MGNSLIEYFNLYRQYAIWVILGVVTLVILLVRYALPLIGTTALIEDEKETPTAGDGTADRPGSG